MKKTDLAYTAGIIDGEGCIYISKQVSKLTRSNVRYGLLIKVASTDEWLPQWLKLAWGGSISVKIANHPRWSNAWDWTIQAQQALAFLKAIQPYLILKRPQAELAIKFQERKAQSRWSNQHLKTAEARLVEEAEYLLMKGMKHNKKKAPW